MGWNPLGVRRGWWWLEKLQIPVPRSQMGNEAQRGQKPSSESHSKLKVGLERDPSALRFPAVRSRQKTGPKYVSNTNYVPST